MEDEVRYYGLTESAIQRTIIARLEEQRAQAASTDSQERTVELLDKEIAARKRLAAAADSKEALDANKQATEDMAKDWEKMHDQLSQSLTDELMRGGQNAGELLKNYFKTIVLRPMIQGVVNAGLSAVGFGGTAQGGQAGSLANVASGAQLGASLYGPVGGLWNGLSSGVGLANTLSMAGGVGTVGSGLYGAFATSAFGQAIGLSSVVPGLMGPTLTGGALGSAAGGATLTGLGAAVPWVAGALVLGSLLGIGESGEKYPSMVGSARGTWSGADNTWTAGDMGYTTPQRGELGSGQFGDPVNTALMNVNRQFAAQIDALAGAFDINVDMALGIATRLRRTSGDLLAGISGTIDGEDFTFSARQRGIDGDVEKGMQGFIAALMTDGIQAAIATLKDLPASIKAIFAEELSQEQIGAAIGAYTTTDKFAESLGGLNEIFAKLTPLIADVYRAADFESLAENASQLDAFRTATANYYGIFYDEGEKWSDAMGALGLTFEEFDIALPRNRDAFRSLVDSLDLTTEAGRETYGTLMAVAPAFAQIVGALENAMNATSTMFETSIRTINLDMLDTEGKYNFLDGEAERYRDVLASLSDPTLIAEYAGRLNDSIMQAWGLLDEGQRQSSGDEYIALLEAADELAMTRYEASRDAAIAQAKENADVVAAAVKVAVKEAMDEANAAAVKASEATAAAATAQTQSNNTLASILSGGINVFSGGQEVGYLGA
jgi:hypothetical protein